MGIEPVLSHVTGEHVTNYTMPSESLVADLGVEPSISEVMGLEWYFRSTHPRYELVGLAGFEPATWCSQSIRSTS